MSNVLKPGYLRWDGSKFVLDPDIEIVGPAGIPGGQGIPGPSGSNAINLPYVAHLAAGEVSTNSVVPLRIGARELDLSLFPSTIGEAVRVVRFIAVIEATDITSSTAIRLYDITNDAVISNTSFSTSEVTLTVFDSGILTVGSSDGNIRDDAVTLYEAQLSMPTGDLFVDRALCTNARIEITYV